MTRSFLDTNVLIYLFDHTKPEKKVRTQEFYVNVPRKLSSPLPSEVAEARVRDFCRLTLVRVDASLILAAIARTRRVSFSFWDALIVEPALSAGVDRLLTEDFPHGQIIDGMRVENPFL